MIAEELNSSSGFADMNVGTIAAVDRSSSSSRPERGLMATLLRCFQQDARTYGTRVAFVHLARSAKIFRATGQCLDIIRNTTYLAHSRYLSLFDPLSFVAHRHYLARGLEFQQRVEAARSHYQASLQLPAVAYRDEVYFRDGLLLWEHVHEDTAYSIKLLPGNDVLYEGALSLVLFVGGQRVCVLSYSNVCGRLLGDALAQAGAPLVPFVVRRHAAGNHDYQKGFNAAFDRTTPGHLCLAALEGISLAQGVDCFYGIAAAAQPSWKDERDAAFKTAYDEFWTSLAGRPVSPLAFRVPLPVALSPLEDMPVKARKRAMARRAHMANVRVAAQAAMARVLEGYQQLERHRPPGTTPPPA